MFVSGRREGKLIESLIWGSGELSISSRSDVVNGGWRLVTVEKRLLRVGNEKYLETDGGCLFDTPIERS